MQSWKYSLFVSLLPVFGLTIPVTASAKDNHSSTAQYTQMKGAELLAVFTDTTMVGEYRNYRDETRTYNYTEVHTVSSDVGGATDYLEGKQHEKGIWTIVGGDKVCYKYPRSDYYTRTYCFFVYESEKCFYKYPPSAMNLRGPKSWDRWTSRAIRKGSGGSCAAAVG